MVIRDHPLPLLASAILAQPLSFVGKGLFLWKGEGMRDSFRCFSTQEAIAFIEEVSSGMEPLQEHLNWCELCAAKIRRLNKMREEKIEDWIKWRNSHMSEAMKQWWAENWRH
jgi:hypothetical protein